MKEQWEKCLYSMLIALLLFGLLLTAVLFWDRGRFSVPTTSDWDGEPSPVPLPQTTNYPREMRYNAATSAYLDEMIHRFVADDLAAVPAIRETLAAYKTMDLGMAELWERVMDYWFSLTADLHLYYDALPDGLPTDDSLCLVVLGYALESDGSMAYELLRRCEVALAAAEQYPNAYILVTGGPTAFLSEGTEAGRMADWLVEHGVAAPRLIVEDRALTTAQNALYAGALLKAYPQVDSVAMITSDYHIAVGSLMFEAEALFEEYETGEKPFSVVANAACAFPNKAGTQGLSVQASFLRSLLSPAARYR